MIEDKDGLVSSIRLIHFNSYPNVDIQIINKKSRSSGTKKNIFHVYSKLAWEPSAAQVTKNYSCRLPTFDRFYRATTFSLFKSTHST